MVVCFYPKDGRRNTRQACAIRDGWGDFERAGATVRGISPQSVASHVKFKKKFDLPFTLLADEDHAVASAYGFWGPKTRYGKTQDGLIRSGFVIDRDGTVAAAKVSVNADKHRQMGAGGTPEAALPAAS